MPVLGNKSISNGSNKEQVRRNIFKSAFMFLIISLQAKGCFFVLFLRNSFILIPIVRVSAKYPVMRKQTSLCFRWHIETAYYEQKKFLSFGKYMLRSRDGTEYLLNLITLAYSMMSLLPFLDSSFSFLSDVSPQQVRFLLSCRIHQDLFFDAFVRQIKHIKDTFSHYPASVPCFVST